jgi:DNA-directed RNA polymerase specialized sigma24 family protein
VSDQDTDGSYTAFVRATWTDHLGVARLLTGDADRAEELLQDCLVKLYPRWRRVAGRGDPQAYLRRMLVNARVSRWRRSRREELVWDAPEQVDPRAVHHEPRDHLQGNRIEQRIIGDDVYYIGSIHGPGARQGASR